MKMTTDEIEAFLAPTRIAVLGTINADGTPALTPVWYLWWDGGFSMIMPCTAPLNSPAMTRIHTASIGLPVPTNPNAMASATANAITAFEPMPTSIRYFFGMRSAITPPTNEATSIGNDCASAMIPSTALKRALSARSHLLAAGLESTRIDVRAMGPAGDGGPDDRLDVIVVAQ